MQKINFQKEFENLSNYWEPKTVGELNGQLVKIAKFKGVFIWHKHQNEDELFWVIKGEIEIQFKDQIVILSENEFFIVPKNAEHKPIAKKEAWVVLFEPKTTLQKGD